MTPVPNQLRFALACLLLIAITCSAIGGFLLDQGFQSGELFVGIVGTIAGAMAGMISMRPHGAGMGEEGEMGRQGEGETAPSKRSGEYGEPAPSKRPGGGETQGAAISPSPTQTQPAKPPTTST